MKDWSFQYLKRASLHQNFELYRTYEICMGNFAGGFDIIEEYFSNPQCDIGNPNDLASVHGRVMNQILPQANPVFPKIYPNRASQSFETTFSARIDLAWRNNAHGSRARSSIAVKSILFIAAAPMCSAYMVLPIYGMQTSNDLTYVRDATTSLWPRQGVIGWYYVSWRERLSRKAGHVLVMSWQHQGDDLPGKIYIEIKSDINRKWLINI